MWQIQQDIKLWNVYKIVNPDGQIYVGITSKLKERVRSYNRYYEYDDTHWRNRPLIMKSLRKYGIEAHNFDVIDTFTSNKPYAEGKEIFWIRTYMSNGIIFPEYRGLNLTRGGQGSLGYVISDEAKKRLSEKLKGKPRFTDEQKKRMSEKRKGNKNRLGTHMSEEQKKKVSEFMKGHKYNLGKKHTKEHIEKTSERNKKPVLQYDLDGSFIQEHSSLKETAIYFNIGIVSMIKHVNGRIKDYSRSSVKYKFKYKNK